MVKEGGSCLDSRIIQSYNTSYLPDKGFTHMNICHPEINLKNPSLQ